jgi:hypothetical protein
MRPEARRPPNEDWREDANVLSFAPSSAKTSAKTLPLRAVTRGAVVGCDTFNPLFSVS